MTLPKYLPALAFSLPLLAAAPALAVTQDCMADLEALKAALLRLPSDMRGSGTNGTGFGAVIGTFDPPKLVEGRCVIQSLTTPGIDSGRTSEGIAAGPISWRADWADEVRGFPPVKLSLSIENLRQTYVSTGDPSDFDRSDGFDAMYDYQNALLAELHPNNLALEYSFDPAAKTLDLARLDLDDGQVNRLALSARLGNIDLAALLARPDMPDQLPMIRVHAADLRLTNGGMFESMALAWLGPIFPRLGDTPEAAVEAAKTLGRAQIVQIPDSLVDSASRTALTAVVDSVPHPLGTLRLTLDAADGVSASQFILPMMTNRNPGWDRFRTALRNVRVTAEWQPKQAGTDE
ncbi:hypothetical protein [Paracoccus pacificus]|uniref:Uncharacterized protein n=1 Tax=Paracoccus pacificus TaxID=1463598 RepID=A0ABW4RBG5_9RHOB